MGEAKRTASQQFALGSKGGAYQWRISDVAGKKGDQARAHASEHASGKWNYREDEPDTTRPSSIDATRDESSSESLGRGRFLGFVHPQSMSSQWPRQDA